MCYKTIKPPKANPVTTELTKVYIHVDGGVKRCNNTVNFIGGRVYNGPVNQTIVCQVNYIHGVFLGFL